MAKVMRDGSEEGRERQAAADTSLKVLAAVVTSERVLQFVEVIQGVAQHTIALPREVVRDARRGRNGRDVEKIAQFVHYSLGVAHQIFVRNINPLTTLSCHALGNVVVVPVIVVNKRLQLVRFHLHLDPI
jgi:hypothetical protein